VANRWTQAATILPPTIEVCGRRLLPFCLRHRVALEAIDSPILSTDRHIGAHDLIFAARILSSRSLDDVGRKVSLREKLYAIYLGFSRKAFLKELVKIHCYLEAQSLWPRFWEKENVTADGGIPWQLNIISGLTKNGITLEEAWTMPEAEAVWLYIAACRLSGAKIDVVSDKEWEAMERYKAGLSSSDNYNKRN
jgi:hypothetical protein